MSKPKLKRPAPGTVLGALALIVAVAGNANALAGGHHALVRKGDIAKGAVTARALAKGAVHPKALAKNAVHASALAKSAVTAKALRSGAVTSAALGANAVTANAIAPDSVRGYALGPVSIHTAPLVDPDTSVDFNWEKSTVEIAQCGTGERLLSGGVQIPAPGSNQMAITTSWPDIPSVQGASPEGWFGQIVSNSGGGGMPAPQVVAACLR